MPFADGSHSDISRVNLPPELICEILEILRENVSALKACSLVSRTFRALCLPYLFSVVQIKVRPGQTSTEVLGTFLSHSTDLASYLHTLILDGHKLRRGGRLSVCVLPVLDVKTLARDVLPRLARLEVLEAFCWVLAPDESSVWVKEVGRLRLKKLALARIRGDITGLLNGGEDETRSPSLQNLGVKTLVVYECSGGSTVPQMQLLKNAGAFDILASIIITPNTISDVNKIAEVIPLERETLRTVVIDLGNLYSWRLPPGLDIDQTCRAAMSALQNKLLQCPALHRFTIILNPDGCTSPFGPILLGWIASLAACLHHLTLLVTGYTSEELPWKEMQSLCRQLSNLRSFALLLHDPAGGSKARGALGEDDSKVERELDERGIYYYGRDPSCKECGCE